MVQETKKIIDVGEIGNASTGDILYDGGIKVNKNFNSIYNAFGDQRLGNVNDGEESQLIHATGYYQKANQYDFRTPISLGTMWDVDTSIGAASPIITKGKPGECVVFINSNGSFSVNTPLMITVSAGSFVGVQNSLVVTAPYSKVVCWCVKNENSVSVWNYSITPLFEQKHVLLEGTYLTETNPKLKICHMNEFESIKFLLTSANQTKTIIKQSEVSLLIDSLNKNVYSTEYAVIRKGNKNEGDNIVNITFEIDSNNFVNMKLSSSVAGLKTAIKTIETLKIGAA